MRPLSADLLEDRGRDFSDRDCKVGLTAGSTVPTFPQPTMLSKIATSKERKRDVLGRDTLDKGLLTTTFL